MSRFDSFGDSFRSDRPRDNNGPSRGNSNRGKDTDFGFSRSTFGTAKDEPAASSSTSSNNRPKTQRPTKDSSWDTVPGAPTNETRVEKKQDTSKPEKVTAGGGFAGLVSDSEDEDEHPKQQQQQQQENTKPAQTTKKPQQQAKNDYPEPVLSSRFAGVTSLPDTSSRPPRDHHRDQRPPREERSGRFDRDERPQRDERPSRDERGFDNTPGDFAGGSRFSAFDFEPTKSERPQRDQRDQRPPRDNYRDQRPPREERSGRFDRDERPRRFDDYPAAPQQPPVQKIEPKTVMAGTNQDASITPVNMVTTTTATGTGGLSQIQTKSASWGATAPTQSVGISFSDDNKPKQQQQQQQQQPQQPKEQTAKAAPETQLQKAVNGTVNTVSLGQLKKNIVSIVPFPTVENGQDNFAAGIAFAITEQEYSLNDLVVVFNKQFIDAYVRQYTKNGKTQDEGKKEGIDVTHSILVKVVKALLQGNDDAKAKVTEYFKDYNVEKLVNFCPNAIVTLTDEAAKRTKAIEYFKANGVGDVLSATDGNEEAAAAAAAKKTADVEIADAIIKLGATATVAQVTAIITPYQAEVKTQLTKNATPFLTLLFTPFVEKNLSKDAIVATLDALVALNLINYDMMDVWQTACTVATVKREMIFKISSWMSAHKPQQFQAYDDEEEDEEFDDGF